MRVIRASVVAIGWLVLIGPPFHYCSALGASQMLQSSSMDIECVIRVQPEKDFVRFEAVVRSAGPVKGQYNLSISKRSTSGISQNNQSGTFTLTTEPEQVLTTVILDRSALGHYQAQLSLNSDRGSVSCVSP
jgi:hypothetical protein